ncbi:MAG: hypothetical protein U1E93_11670 [Alphaproteobacteria bacterium]
MAELLTSFGIDIQVTMSKKFGEGDTMRPQAGSIRGSSAARRGAQDARRLPQVTGAAGTARMGEQVAARRLRHRRAPRGTAPERAEAMGAKIDLAEGYVTATAPDGLKGARSCSHSCQLAPPKPP